MAAPQAQLRAGRYFLTLLIILAVMYALLFFTGSTNTPKLGLDLQGGSTVTLQAVTDNGQPPSRDAMNTARNIIENRVNGRGISSAEVVVENGQNIVISIPGDDQDQARTLGSTALLRFRPVVAACSIGAVATPTPTATGSGSGTATPTGSGTPSGGATSGAGVSGAPTSTANGRVVPHALAPSGTATGTATPTGSATGTPSGSATGSATPSGSGTATGSGPQPVSCPDTSAVTAEQLAQLNALDCDNRPADNKPKDTIAACDQVPAGQPHTVKYLLAPSIIEGTEISGAAAQYDTQQLQGWVVTLDFKSAGQKTWAEYTAANVGANVAFTLDGEVISAPTIQGAINGSTQISGSFNEETATDLANSLKYGALPLTFKTLTGGTISPSLGTDQMKAGLLAGGIGLILVVIYTLLYYRALGIVTIASLLVSGLLTYASLVLLGRYIGFTLTLAGIAGFIVAVGITADSFVVFFERLKDEVREGRSGRSAVPRAWVRARRTILSADAVSFLAAAVLYYLAAGEVKGFAFTLGLSTILDLVVVFLFTHPLIAVVSRKTSFTTARWSGLAAVRKPKSTPTPATAAS